MNQRHESEAPFSLEQKPRVALVGLLNTQIPGYTFFATGVTTTLNQPQSRRGLEVMM